MSLFLFTLVNILAGVFQGVVGFGQGLIATPTSLTFLSKSTALTAMIFNSVILNGYLARKIAEPLDRKIFTPLLISSLVGLPFGVIILKVIQLNSLRIMVGALSIILTIVTVFIRLHLKNLKFVTPLTGFVAGMLETSTSMPGPMVVLLLTSTRVTQNRMRKTLVWYFFILSVVTLGLYFLSNVLRWQGIVYGMVAAPFIVLAGHLGNKLSHRVPHRWYRVVALLTVAATGAYAIYAGIR